MDAADDHSESSRSIPVVNEPCVCVQLEFFAEDEIITIVPNFSLPTFSRSTLSCIGVRTNLCNTSIGRMAMP
jgi:hypothetical protein